MLACIIQDVVATTKFYKFLNQTSSPNVMQSTGRPLKDTY